MNNMSTDQVSTVLRAVLSQATGQTDLAALNINQLLSIGQKTLVTAKDPLITSISQVIRIVTRILITLLQVEA